MSAGPRVLALRLTNGELADRLKLLALHPTRFSREENVAVLDEAADRLDTSNKVVEVEFPNGHKMWKFVVNAYTYWFPEHHKAIEFQHKVEGL